METTIKGALLGHRIDITINSALDGKEVAIFLADFYSELMAQAPGVLANAEKHTTPIAMAMRKLNQMFERVAKTLGE